MGYPPPPETQMKLKSRQIKRMNEISWDLSFKNNFESIFLYCKNNGHLMHLDQNIC